MRPPQVGQVLVLSLQLVGFLLHQLPQLPVVPLDLLLLLLVPLSPPTVLLVLLFDPQQPLCVCEKRSRCYPVEKESWEEKLEKSFMNVYGKPRSMAA